MCACEWRDGERQKRSRTSFRHCRKLLGAAEPIARTPPAAAAADETICARFPGSKAFIKRPGGGHEQTPQRPDDERGLPKQNNIATVAVFTFSRSFGDGSPPRCCTRQFCRHPPPARSPPRDLRTLPANDDRPEATRSRSRGRRVEKYIGRHAALRNFRPPGHNHDSRHSVGICAYYHNIVRTVPPNQV